MASDADEGRNAAIDFSVVGGVGVFAVGAQTGQLVVAGAVGTLGTEHKITIQAADRGGCCGCSLATLLRLLLTSRDCYNLFVIIEDLTDSRLIFCVSEPLT